MSGPWRGWVLGANAGPIAYGLVCSSSGIWPAGNGSWPSPSGICVGWPDAGHAGVQQLGAELYLWDALLAAVDTTLIPKVRGQMPGVQKWHDHSGDPAHGESLVGHHWALIGLVSAWSVGYLVLAGVGTGCCPASSSRWASWPGRTGYNGWPSGRWSSRWCASCGSTGRPVLARGGRRLLQQGVLPEPAGGSGHPVISRLAQRCCGLG